MESKKSLLSLFFQRGQFDHLKIAVICFVVASILMLNLFQNPFVQITNSFVFDDVSTFRNGFFYDYFLNFSTAFSSIITVVGFVLFVLFQVVMLNHYVNTWGSSYLFLIVLSIIGFYFLITTIVPFVERKEAEYLAGSEISQLVYNQNYNEAYGIVQGSRATDYAKTYMTAQISLQKVIDHKGDIEYEELLLSDAHALNYEIIANDNNLIAIDSSILYRIYNATGNNEQLTSIKQVVDKERIVGISYIAAIIILQIIGSYNLIVYRRVVGM